MSKSAAAEPKTTTVEVEIFGATYNVRGPADPEHLENLAAVVDARMRDIASRVSTVDSTKIAVLAALNLAEDVYRNQGTGERRGEIVGFEDRLRDITSRLERLLDEKIALE
jgi:cell division protein ZapA